jgi:hypothetical protein
VRRSTSPSPPLRLARAVAYLQENVIRQSKRNLTVAPENLTWEDETMMDMGSSSLRGNKINPGFSVDVRSPLDSKTMTQYGIANSIAPVWRGVIIGSGQVFWAPRCLPAPEEAEDLSRDCKPLRRPRLPPVERCRLAAPGKPSTEGSSGGRHRVDTPVPITRHSLSQSLTDIYCPYYCDPRLGARKKSSKPGRGHFLDVVFLSKGPCREELMASERIVEIVQERLHRRMKEGGGPTLRRGN